MAQEASQSRAMEKIDCLNKCLKRVEENRLEAFRNTGERVAALRRDVNQLLERRSRKSNEMTLRLILVVSLLFILDSPPHYVELPRLNQETSLPGSLVRQKGSHPVRESSKIKTSVTSSSSSTSDVPILEPNSHTSTLDQEIPDRGHHVPQGSSRRSVRWSVSGWRTSGPRFLRLRELRPTNNLYTAVLSYWSYRLVDTNASRSSRAAGKVRVLVKRMNLKLSDHTILENDLIMVLNFLLRFVRDAIIQAMTEDQVLKALQCFQIGFARSQYMANVERVCPKEGSVTSWTEAVQFLLRSYAQNMQISAAFRDLRAVRQQTAESNCECATRLDHTVSRYCMWIPTMTLKRCSSTVCCQRHRLKRRITGKLIDSSHLWT